MFLGLLAIKLIQLRIMLKSELYLSLPKQRVNRNLPYFRYEIIYFRNDQNFMNPLSKCTEKDTGPGSPQFCHSTVDRLSDMAGRLPSRGSIQSPFSSISYQWHIACGLARSFCFSLTEDRLTASKLHLAGLAQWAR